MHSIRRQFLIYFISLLSFCIGAISTKNIPMAGLLFYAPVGLLLLLNWDDKKYQERHPESQEEEL